MDSAKVEIVAKISGFHIPCSSQLIKKCTGCRRCRSECVSEADEDRYGIFG